MTTSSSLRNLFQNGHLRVTLSDSPQIVRHGFHLYFHEVWHQYCWSSTKFKTWSHPLPTETSSEWPPYGKITGFPQKVRNVLRWMFDAEIDGVPPISEFYHICSLGEHILEWQYQSLHHRKVFKKSKMLFVGNFMKFYTHIAGVLPKPLNSLICFPEEPVSERPLQGKITG